MPGRPQRRRRRRGASGWSSCGWPATPGPALWYASVLLLPGARSRCWCANWRIFGRRRRRADREPEVPPGRVRLAVRVAGHAGAAAGVPVRPAAVRSPRTAPRPQPGSPTPTTGPTRHAITVGFVSLMIVGVAAKVVPIAQRRATRAGCRPVGAVRAHQRRLHPAGGRPDGDRLGRLGVPPRRGERRAGGGRAGGVGRPPGRPDGAPAGVGRRGRRAREPAAASPGATTCRTCSTGTRTCWPSFLAFGFRPLANPVLRRTAARGVTIDLACRIAGVDRPALLAALNARLPAAPVALPVLAPGPVG